MGGSSESCFGFAAKSLDSEVWILPEGRGLYTGTSPEGSFKKNETPFPNRGCWALRSAVQHRGTEPGGTGVEHGVWGRREGNQPRSFFKIM